MIFILDTFCSWLECLHNCVMKDNGFMKKLMKTPILQKMNFWEFQNTPIQVKNECKALFVCLHVNGIGMFNRK